jgi:hypothetical protein
LNHQSSSREKKNLKERIENRVLEEEMGRWSKKEAKHVLVERWRT